MRKAELPAVSEAIFRPTQGLKETTFDRSRQRGIWFLRTRYPTTNPYLHAVVHQSEQLPSLKKNVLNCAKPRKVWLLIKWSHFSVEENPQNTFHFKMGAGWESSSILYIPGESLIVHKKKKKRHGADQTSSTFRRGKCRPIACGTRTTQHQDRIDNRSKSTKAVSTNTKQPNAGTQEAKSSSIRHQAGWQTIN